MPTDPAIIEARALLKERRVKDAVRVYERRINEQAAYIVAMKGARATSESFTSSRAFIRATVAIILIAVLLALVFLVIPEMFNRMTF